MPITVRNKEADALMAEIRKATGKGPSEVVLEALRKWAGELDEHRAEKRRRFDEWYKEYLVRLERDYPHVRSTSTEEIFDEMYDENGLPR